MPITPLLVTIFVQQAIVLGREGGASGIRELPSSVPEAYFAYVEQLDRSKHSLDPSNLDHVSMLRAAAALIAFVELGHDFRPKPISRQVVEEALKADPRFAGSTVPFTRRLEANGLLTRRQAGATETVEYILDPIAECLAGFEHARRCGADAACWSQLLQRVTARGELARGFLHALRMNYAAYANELGFAVVTFPDAAGEGTPIEPPRPPLSEMVAPHALAGE